MLGTVAHELRQPLSNIESIAYYLSMVLPRGDEKVQGHLARIRELVEQSNWILSSGVRLAGESAPAPRSLRFEDLVKRVVSQSSCANARLRMEIAPHLPRVDVDPAQGAALVETLLLMLLPLASSAHPLLLRLTAPPEGGVALCLEGSLRLPQASLGAGSALAIESARRIALAHGGSLVVESPAAEAGSAGRIRVCVVLP